MNMNTATNTVTTSEFLRGQAAGIGALQAQPTQVENELNELRCITESNHKLALEIEQRLSRVLMPSPPTDCKNSPEVALVEFAEHIRDVRRRGENCNSVLRSVLERIQL